MKDWNKQRKREGQFGPLIKTLVSRSQLWRSMLTLCKSVYVLRG